MTELVINAPHLQTRWQRFAAVALTLAGWLLWCYLLFPLVALGCWFLDYAECSQWVNMSGGYLNLKDVLVVYLENVAAMAAIWILWVGYNRLKGPPPPERQPRRISHRELCRTLRVSSHELKECQESRFAVVHYDQAGHILGLEKGNP